MSTTQHPKGRDCERTEEVLNNYRDRAIAAESALAAIPEPPTLEPAERRCEWCEWSAASCHELRLDKRKCCPDCRHPVTGERLPEGKFIHNGRVWAVRSYKQSGDECWARVSMDLAHTMSTDLRRDLEHGQRTRAIIAAGKLTLDRQERHDLAELLVDHAGSWRTLSEDDARRIADALDAFLAVQALLRMRRLHRL